jgi:hypothetical protein
MPPAPDQPPLAEADQNLVMHVAHSGWARAYGNRCAGIPGLYGDARQQRVHQP